MAKNSKSARRPAAKQLAAQRNATRSSSGAARPGARRPQQRRRSNSSRSGWIAVGVVLVVAAVFIIVKATGSSSNATDSSATSSGRNPALATAAITTPLATVPASVFNAIGVATMPATLTVTAKQPLLRSGSLSRFVYVGAEYCPYCAMDRWAMVTALDRFGSFTGLKQIDSSSTDTPASIPTLSFLGSKYTSKYIVFTPYEEEDRNRNPLETVPNDVSNLFSTYDAPPNGNGTVFNNNSGGIPFIDVANKYVSAGTPTAFQAVINGTENDSLTHVQIAQAVNDPTSAVGVAMGAKYIVGEANYLSAAVCAVDGAKPASVCGSKGVSAAAAILKASKPIS